MKAKHPITDKTKYFLEKNLPFGSSISCSHFQRFSNCLKHIFEYLVGADHAICTNYLDDFLFVAPSSGECNRRVRIFLNLCKRINVPVALKKTEWASENITFLGINLNRRKKILTIPEEKRQKVLNWLNYVLGKNKATIKELEKFTDLLNFMGRAIVPGKAFTRRMYAKFTGAKNAGLKSHHHVHLDSEFKDDCRVWRSFIINESGTIGISRPYLDFSDESDNTVTLNMYSDAAVGIKLGFGAWFKSEWCLQQWKEGFIVKFNPSIEFLELYAMCMAIFIRSQTVKHQVYIVL